MLYLQFLCVASKFLKLAKWPCLGTGPAAWLQGPVGKFKLTLMSMGRFPTATGKLNALFKLRLCIQTVQIAWQFSLPAVSAKLLPMPPSQRATPWHSPRARSGWPPSLGPGPLPMLQLGYRSHIGNLASDSTVMPRPSWESGTSFFSWGDSDLLVTRSRVNVAQLGYTQAVAQWARLWFAG